jgi:hypothetical protein
MGCGLGGRCWSGCTRATSSESSGCSCVTGSWRSSSRG